VAGFAMTPLVLVAAAVVPVEFVRVAVALLSTALLLACFVVGVRQALGVTTGRAAFVFFVVFMTFIFGSFVATYLLGGGSS
jgi:hypothetical protein